MAKINNKLLIRILFFLLITGVFAFLFFNDSGILKYIKLKNEIEKLNSEIKNAEDTLQKLEAEIDSLKISKNKIEQVAREKFHMLKPNEQVLKIEEN